MDYILPLENEDSRVHIYTLPSHQNKSNKMPQKPKNLIEIVLLIKYLSLNKLICFMA